SDAPASSDAPPGSNMISGSVGGKTFGTVGASYVIGMPDSPSTDTVVYLFDGAVACSSITAAGWDSNLPAGTQVLELKMVGKAPATYAQTTAATHVPAPGEAAVSYTLAMPSATDMIASGGTVTLSTLSASAATGTFHVTFSNGMLDGKFDAPACANGREP
ncbi:MAG: hypothetical protein JO257_33980, partial [Deltaproteobacteria bacterium]|nr:hypothetical protein [Deltaproteobacteria bacterium]